MLHEVYAEGRLDAVFIDSRGLCGRSQANAAASQLVVLLAARVDGTQA